MVSYARLAVIFLLQCALADAQGSGGWVYANSGATAADSAAQVATWGGLCVSGKEQSPINVVTANAVKTMMPVITVQWDKHADIELIDRYEGSIDR